jgi:hypothetical protein
MACTIVPTAVGVITTAFGKKFPKKLHIDWLNTMIFGGAIALGVEHIFHGEIVPWPPFLTAMSNPTDTAMMFSEMAAIGIPMTLALVFVWAMMVVAYERFMVRIENLKNHRLNLLSLMFIGTAMLVLVDNGMKMLGGEQITNGISPGAIMLAVLMLTPLFAIWIIVIGYERLQANALRTTG